MDGLTKGLTVKEQREYITSHGLCESLEGTPPGGMLSACYVSCKTLKKCLETYDTGCPMVGAIKR